MLAGLTTKARELWRAINDEQDTPRRWVLRARLCLLCCVLLLPLLWLLTKLEADQRALLGHLFVFLVIALFVLSVCHAIIVIVRRAQHRLASQGLPCGILRAAVYSFVKGDASIKLACLLTVLALARLWVGPSESQRDPFSVAWPVIWIIHHLFIAGVLPKDRYFAGPPPQASTERKIAWVVVGVISGLILVVGFHKVRHCGCSLSEAAPQIIEPLFGAGLAFAFCLMLMNFNDPLARRRLNYSWASAPRRTEFREGEAGSRLSPG